MAYLSFQIFTRNFMGLEKLKEIIDKITLRRCRNYFTCKKMLTCKVVADLPPFDILPLKG